VAKLVKGDEFQMGFSQTMRQHDPSSVVGYVHKAGRHPRTMGDVYIVTAAGKPESL
jgi:hypothetical protein